MNSMINVVGIACISVAMIACTDNKKDAPTSPKACYGAAEFAALPPVKMNVDSISRIQDIEDENVARFDIDSQIELNGEMLNLKVNLLVPGNEEVTVEAAGTGDYKVLATVRCAGLMCEDVFIKYDVLAAKDSNCTASEVLQVGVLAQEDAQHVLMSTAGDYYTVRKAGEFRTMDETVTYLNGFRSTPMADQLN